jgi:SagB-type dehydrogenase family enzyme
MKVIFVIGLMIISFFLPACTNPDTLSTPLPTTPIPASTSTVIKLPAPVVKSDFSVEESFLKRRSIREYSQSPLKLEDVSQLLWSAQGITSESGGRTAPSAGALYPLEVYLISGNIDSLNPGVYRYQPQDHGLISIRESDIRQGLANAALGQTVVRDAAADIVITAVYERTTQKYGDRGIRYAQMETGHAAQNILLQATALNLGAVTVGAFDDNQVKTILNMPENESPLYIIPVGEKK